MTGRAQSNRFRVIVLDEDTLFYLTNIVGNWLPVFRRAYGRLAGRANVNAIREPKGSDKRYLSDKIMKTERCEEAQTYVCRVEVWVHSNGAIVWNQTGEIRR